ncbi:hypothetical protein ACJZ2D_008332 [Fusarium nematophilum]
MADPFSIASGVAGVVSLGITLCDGLHTYLSAIKDRGEDVQTAREHLTDLRANIDLIGSSVSTLDARYAKAKEGVRRGLVACGRQLQDLENVIKELAEGDGSPNLRGKWQRQRAAAMYPFHKKKLAQVQDRLRSAKDVLGTFVQILILNVGVATGEDLEALTTAVKDGNITTHESLQGIKDSLDVIGPLAQETRLQLTAVSTQFQQQAELTSSSHALVQQMSVELSTQPAQLAAISSRVEEVRDLIVNQRRCLEPTERDPTPRYIINSDLEQRRNQDLMRATCSCQSSGDRPAYRRVQRIHQSWGGLDVAKEVKVQGRHRPGCSLYVAESLKKSTTTVFTYSGLRWLLSKAVALSVQSNSGAGAYSITHQLRMCNMVESSPAFDILPVLHPLGFRTDPVSIAWMRNPIACAKQLKHELQLVYASSRASPLDVDRDGYNIAHLLVRKLAWLLAFAEGTRHGTDQVIAFRTLFLYLYEIGVNFNASTYDHSTILDVVAAASYFPHNVSSIFITLNACDTNLDLLLTKRLPTIMNYGISMAWDDAFRAHPGFAEALDYEEIFKAIFRRDEKTLRSLLSSDRLVDYISSRDKLGRNILHMCSNWALGLQLILRHESTHSLMNEHANNGLPPVCHSLEISGSICKYPDNWTLCRNCDCSETLQIFLDMDCAVFIWWHWSFKLLERASTKARLLFLQHLKNRRERLRDVAMAHLPATQLLALGVTKERIPDMRAGSVWNALGDAGVKVPDALQVSSADRGLMCAIRCPKVAELAFDLGFHDIDTGDKKGNTPILLLEPYPDALPVLEYAAWLLLKGARLDTMANSLGISACHSLGQIFAYWIMREYLHRSRFPTLPSPELVRLLSIICHNQAQAHVPCPCSTDGTLRPLRWLLTCSMDGKRSPMILKTLSFSDKVRFAISLVDFLVGAIDGLDASDLARPITRLLTMRSLGINHVPACCQGARLWSEEYLQDPERQDEWREMLDEQRPLIEQLEELDEEFEHEFLHQSVSLEDFLWGYWRQRMRQTLRDHRRPLSEGQEQGFREVGVVLDEPGDADCDSDGSGYDDSHYYDSDPDDCFSFFDDSEEACDDEREEADDKEEEHEDDEVES